MDVRHTVSRKGLEMMGKSYRGMMAAYESESSTFDMWHAIHDIELGETDLDNIQKMLGIGE